MSDGSAVPVEPAPPVVRDATSDDLPGILAIVNDSIAHSTAVWTDEPETLDDRRAWLEARQDAGDVVLVAELDGTVAGYAAFAQWRGKTGYRHSVEDSVYVAAGFQGRGLGRMLLVELIERARGAGRHVMIADIEAGNAASIGLHESLGFEHQGLLREIGTKFDRWLDLAILVKRL